MSPHAVQTMPTAKASSTKNVVIFGESGVGKSSLINLIAGRPIAATSNDAMGCTSYHEKYELQVDDTPHTIWDTAGLNEGTYGTVPAATAEKHLRRLLHDLASANGIHLLIYCIRASRLRKALLSNYNLFYSAICRKKAPIVAVVTGLERYEKDMGDWWTANEPEFVALKMHFDGHACVTTLNADEVDSPVLKHRCRASRQAMLSLIANTACAPGWRAAQDGWVSAALADARTMLKPTVTQHNNTEPAPIIALYDLQGYTLGPIVSVKDTSFDGGRLVDVCGNPFLVYRIHDQHARAGVRFRKQISSRGADLLIFCASVHSSPSASQQHAATFCDSFGGDMRPLLVIVKGAPSDECAYEWWNTGGDDHHHKNKNNHSGKLQAIICALPPAESVNDRRIAVGKLQQTIQTRSLQPVASPGRFRWLIGLGRSAKLSTSPDTIFVQEDSLTSSEVWVPRP